MNRKRTLILILFAVTAFSAVISHGLISWLGIETTFGTYWTTGEKEGRPDAFMAGSSLSGDAISWGEVGDSLHLSIEGWGVAGSSPPEWEPYQNRTKQAFLTILVVSPYDLNEHILCDFRADVVPLQQTIRDLWQSRSDWPYCKRVLSQYPLAYLRTLFPTAGRSNGVMVGVREKLRSLLGVVYPMESESAPAMTMGGDTAARQEKQEKISDWSEGRMLRRLAAMRSGCLGLHAFNGPKKLAFLRMVNRAREQGQVVVVALPVSPAYAAEFLTPDVMREYEESLAEVQAAAPDARWIRLDKLGELNSNDRFWDLVHMNAQGKQIATKAFLDQTGKGSGAQ
jgi:hypothetical protein